MAGVNLLKTSLCVLVVFLVCNSFVVSAEVETADVSVTVLTTQCNDSADNDGDGLIDLDDPGCDDGADDDETNAVVTYQCNDSSDNDGDGKIDYPSDLGCDSSTDDSEDSDAVITGGGGIPDLLGGGTTISFEGSAFPAGKITILKDGVIVKKATINSTGYFTVQVNTGAEGIYNFTLKAHDKDGKLSDIKTYAVFVTSGMITQVAQIIFPPTLTLDKSEVKFSETINAFGYSMPKRQIGLFINGSSKSLNLVANSDAVGFYMVPVNSSNLSLGIYRVQAFFEKAYSYIRDFAVGDKNIWEEKIDKCPESGDLNNDCRVNLYDFSIAAYWWERALEANFAKKESASLNGDGRVNIFDFSIMAFYWTG